ncbi:MAG: heat-inducible transcriptional repressor HrcA [Pseudomonadota bacterium]
MNEKLSTRDQEILEILIADYIATALPVGSRTISKKHGVHYSAATIRSVLAELEEMGLLKQPHTSAGRIPTAYGLRYYVNTLLKCRNLTLEEQESLKKKYLASKGLGMEAVLDRTSQTLSAISNYVGLVTSASKNQVVFKQIQFVLLSKKRILGIFVSQEGLVQNKLIEVNNDLNYADLEKINNYVNNAFLGLTIEQAKKKIGKELAEIKKDYDQLLSQAMLFSQELFAAAGDAHLVFDGEAHLVGEPEFSKVEQLKNILEMLREKELVLSILEGSQKSEGVQIFIGAESDLNSAPNYRVAMEKVSVVSAPFKKDGRVLGYLGVIGPMRMDYSRVIPVVDFTAKILEDIL